MPLSQTKSAVCSTNSKHSVEHLHSIPSVVARNTIVSHYLTLAAAHLFHFPISLSLRWVYLPFHPCSWCPPWISAILQYPLLDASAYCTPLPSPPSTSSPQCYWVSRLSPSISRVKLTVPANRLCFTANMKNKYLHQYSHCFSCFLCRLIPKHHHFSPLILLCTANNAWHLCCNLLRLAWRSQDMLRTLLVLWFSFRFLRSSRCYPLLAACCSPIVSAIPFIRYLSSL